MTRITLGALALALILPACTDIIEPDDDRAPADVVAAPYAANALVPAYEYGPAFAPPPVQPQATFWTCAGEAEGRFVEVLIQIQKLVERALQEPDPLRKVQLFAQVARSKHEAKVALYYALQECLATYGPPRFFALPDENGNLVFQPFSLDVYHAYLVEKYLGWPE